ncbi:MAG: TraR/DksA C4-type zinc finger protein [Pedosphaera parvula]|nr:TraR/DksA C4-type zinc finger protein [Pedosphaera parvula]
MPLYCMEKTTLKTKLRRAPRRKRADSKDILGLPAPGRPVPRQWKDQYRHLVELRARFLEHKDDLAHDAREEQPAFSLHMADAATDEYDRDWAFGMISAEQNALYEIDQALHRIWNGTYGICELTGKPIETERLKAIPWTRHSRAAELELERDGAVDRSRLGERSRVPKESTHNQVPEES